MRISEPYFYNNIFYEKYNWRAEIRKDLNYLFFIMFHNLPKVIKCIIRKNKLLFCRKKGLNLYKCVLYN